MNEKDEEITTPTAEQPQEAAAPAEEEVQESHMPTIGGIPARYVKAKGRYHAFAMDELHLYQIDVRRQAGTTTAFFRIDGSTVITAQGGNFEMMKRAAHAMARAAMAYKAKSHRQSKAWRRRKREARKAERGKADE